MVLPSWLSIRSVLKHYSSMLHSCRVSYHPWIRRIAQAFDFMGHPNILEYPLDYWAIKLHDRWIREHLSILEDPFYGLTEVPIVAKDAVFLDHLPQGMYAIGSYPLHLAGYSERGMNDFLYDRIDICFTESYTYNVSTYVALNFMEQDGEYCYDRTSPYVHPMDIQMKFFIRDDRFHACYAERIYMRGYRSPTAIAHDSSVDCNGFILPFDDGTPHLYATKLALYAVHHMVNWMDPKMMSDAYASEMSKYMARGFKPMLPLFPVPYDNHVLQSRIKTIGDAAQKAYDEILRDMPNKRLQGHIPQKLDGQDDPFHKLSYLLMHSIIPGNMPDDLEKYLVNIPKDAASTIILAAMSSLYIPKSYEVHCRMPNTPIEDIREWYMSSSLLAMEP